MSNLREEAAYPAPAARSAAAGAPWDAIPASDHFVQFYEADPDLTSAVAGYFSAGLDAGDSCIIIATAAHRCQIEINLAANGHDLALLRSSGRYVSFDAAATIATFLVDGRPDSTRFAATIGPVIEAASSCGRQVRAFGEMVALLYDAGNRPAAIELERLWNVLSHSHSFALFCAYPVHSFSDSADAAPFADICGCHTRVIPAATSAVQRIEEGPQRHILRLQQCEKALQAEIARTTYLETVLLERDNELAAVNARLRRAMTETHHRVKNSLQLVFAMIDMQRSAGRDTVPVSALASLGSSVRALSVIHGILTQQARTGSEEEELSAKEVLDELLAMVRAVAGNRGIIYSCDDARLSMRQATALALAANELVGNALKHGCTVVTVGFTVYGGTATLEVCDDGPGFPHGFDAFATCHTGLELIESAVRSDLRGTSDYATLPKGGARVTVAFPIAA